MNWSSKIRDSDTSEAEEESEFEQVEVKKEPEEVLKKKKSPIFLPLNSIQEKKAVTQG